MYEDYLIAPLGENLHLYGVQPSGITLIAELPGWPAAAATSVGEDGWIAAANCGSNPGALRPDRPHSILIAKAPDGDGLFFTDELKLPRLSLEQSSPNGDAVPRLETGGQAEPPSNPYIWLHAIIIDGSRLYAGGRCGSGPWVAWLELTDSSREWHLPDLGLQLFAEPGKAIDAFAISGPDVIAFDNMAMPLLAAAIPRNEPGATGKTRILSVRSHYTYERIGLCVAGENFGAHLSGGINHGMVIQFISTWMHPFNGAEHCLLRNPLSPDGPDRYESARRAFSLTWSHLATTGHRLLVAAGPAGLGIWDSRQPSGLIYRPDLAPVERVFTSPVMTDRALICWQEAGKWHNRLVDVGTPDSSAVAFDLSGMPQEFSPLWRLMFQNYLTDARDRLIAASKEQSDDGPHLDPGVIGKIDEGLERLRDGRFGFCEMCGKEIGTDLLVDRPMRVRCNNCHILYSDSHPA